MAKTAIFDPEKTLSQGPYAHSLPGHPLDQWEELGKHLHDVAEQAAGRAASIGLAGAARVAGLLHDIGKTSPTFQDYIRGRAERGGDHATAGAKEAIAIYGDAAGSLLALVIAGHHSGLLDPDGLKRRLDADLPAYRGWQLHAGPLPPVASLRPTRKPRDAATSLVTGAFPSAFMVRMLFSCLVDADFIATETFMRQGALARGGASGLAVLRNALQAHLGKLQSDAAGTDLNAIRNEILTNAVAKAGEPPGFFTLTVPTGGGKTLASLAFALEHALRHGKRRVVVVIPFTAIIEQTAAVYRQALGMPDAVLEHHASFDWEEAANARGDAGDETDGLGRLRRAAENWDAPIIVTTAVQFFESLYSNRTSRCRKLHNLADSVIVLDEAQATPAPLLLPCIAALDELQRAYGASIVLCTATQPAWRRQDGALIRHKPSGARVELGIDIPESRELAPRAAEIYAALRRVSVDVMPEPIDDDALAAAFAKAPQMLCIVNSRAHARAVFERIAGRDGAVHLTTLMCPAHRRTVLRDLKQRLKNGLPVRLVATSLIEAGVDISFPEVWRATAGLDAIAQAAGRCNREGELLPALGRVVVFNPADSKPPAALRPFQEAAARVLRDHTDPLGMDAVGAYFRELYFLKGDAALDAAMVCGRPGILPAIEEADGFRAPFESIATAFRMIDDAMQPVIVPWGDKATRLLAVLGATDGPFGSLLRALQPYVVGIPEKARADWLASGVLAPVRRELGGRVLRLTDMGYYSPSTGLDLSDGAYRTAEQNIW
jgi:CRISPR-associated endonuclease/helicase Cas3